MTEKQIRRVSVNGIGIPEHMIAAVLRYFNEHMLMPTDFLEAVLENNFLEAFRRADDKNLAAMHTWAAFLYNEAPMGPYGSPEKVKAWIAQREELHAER